jgi:uncharacterized protein
MKRAVLRAIEAWQANQNRPRGRCLHTPTCSAYGHQVISRYGVARGAVMTAGRIFTCNGCLTAAPGRPSGQRAPLPAAGEQEAAACLPARPDKR